MSNEKEIRELVRQMLNSQFKDSYTFDEFSGGNLRTRPDLATFLPNQILFIEIKSDKDTLDRLDRQQSDYSKYADFVYTILDVKHHKKWVSKYGKMHNDIGYTYFYDNGKLYVANDELEIQVKEFQYWEQISSKIDILSFLWKSERYAFTGFIKGRTKILYEEEVIKNLYTAREIIDMSHYILFDRAKERNKSKNKKFLTYNGGHYPFSVEYKEHRQYLFNLITSDSVVRQNKAKKIIAKNPYPWLEK